MKSKFFATKGFVMGGNLVRILIGIFLFISVLAGLYFVLIKIF